MRMMHLITTQSTVCIDSYSVMYESLGHMLDYVYNIVDLVDITTVCLPFQLSCYLITSLIDMYIDDHAATDAISERLRDVCPALYSMEDAVCSKVNTLIKYIT